VKLESKESLIGGWQELGDQTKFNEAQFNYAIEGEADDEYI